MLKPSHLFGLGAVLGLLGTPGLARAGETMNPALSRFVIDHRCQAEGLTNGSYEEYATLHPTNVGVFNDGPQRAQYTRTSGRDSCVGDSAMFKQLMNQWGFAFAPTAMHSARTTGFGGFHFSIEAAYTKIDNNATYWKLGTQGPREPSSNKGSILNSGPPSVLQLYSVRLRKNFGFGLELATQVGFMPATTLLSGGADVRMSLLEGFRTGFAGILPDVAVGGGVRTITGTPEFQLTTVGLDVQISKPITIASQSVLTPWIGYQYLWIFGDSGLIDTTPATDPVAYCRSSGQNVPGNPDPGKNTTSGQVYDGQPVCAGGSPIDFNNNIVFHNARLERQRGIVGLNYRYEMVSIGGEFIFDLVDPADAQTGSGTIYQPTAPTGIAGRGGTAGTPQERALTDKDILKGVPRQWTMVFEVGAFF